MNNIAFLHSYVLNINHNVKLICQFFFKFISYQEAKKGKDGKADGGKKKSKK